MEKCACYHVYEDLMIGKRHVCYGTKECDACSCGGDPTKCDFYPKKRKETKKLMKTAEMWLAAQESGGTYCCGDMAYSVEKGLYDPDIDRQWPMNAFRTFSELMEYEWEEVKFMTRSEAEDKLGVRIID